MNRSEREGVDRPAAFRAVYDADPVLDLVVDLREASVEVVAVEPAPEELRRKGPAEDHGVLEALELVRGAVLRRRPAGGHLRGGEDVPPHTRHA